MDFLREALTNVRRLDQPTDSAMPDDELSLDLPDEASVDDPLEQDPSQETDPEMDLDLDSDQTGEEPSELDDIADGATEDPDRAGMIRTVKNAHLVYKRETEEGTFEELWIYNIDSLRSEMETKKAILAGTDIPPNRMSSPDGSQTYEIWSAGNAEMLLIKGLPS